MARRALQPMKVRLSPAMVERLDELADELAVSKWSVL
jgi:hypothetical protein